MLNSVYTFRVDEKTRQKLQKLAGLTHRSRANLLRWLINQAEQNPHLVMPFVVKEDRSKSSDKPIMNDGLGEVCDESE
jgi:predicted transcriptional regulator